MDSISKPTAKAFSYGTLLAILQYMDPNQRIFLSQKCPYIRSIEKSASLKIHRLELQSSSFQVDNIFYSLEIVRFHTEKKRIWPFQDEEFEFKVTWNIDEKGLPVLNGAMTPGDLKFSGGENFRVSIIDRQNPLVNYLKFTVETRDVVYVEIIKYNQNFDLALKYLNTRIFGKRDPIKVVGLIIKPKGFLRLPEGLKFKTHTLQVSEIMEEMDKLRPLVNFPLKRITTDALAVQDHEFMAQADEIHVERLIGDFGNPQLPFKRLHCKFMLDYPRFIDIVMDWKRGHTEIGTWFSFEMDYQSGAGSVLLFFGGRYELGATRGFIPEIGSTTHPYCIIFPINEQSEIIIYCSNDIPGADDADDEMNVLNMMVQQKGYGISVG